MFGGGVSTSELRSAARQLAAGLRLARSEAVSQRRETFLVLDLAGRRFKVDRDPQRARAAARRRAEALHRAEGPRRRQGRLDPLLSRRRQQRRPHHRRLRRAQVRSRRRLADRPRRDPRLTSGRPPRCDSPRSRTRGFSLLEVLVAFVILALVATALFRLFSGALNNASAAEEWSRALLVAESRARGRPPPRSRCAKRPIAAPRRRRPHALGDARRRRTPHRTRRSRARARVARRSPTRALPRHASTCAFPAPTGKRAHAVAVDASGSRARNPLMSRRRRHPHAERGFTLIELMIALALLALHVGRAVRLAAARRPQLGRAARRRSKRRPAMRLAQEFLRTQSRGAASAAHAQDRSSSRCSSPASATSCATRRALPARVAGGGMWYYRLARAHATTRARRSCSSA